ncbi:MAG TPA: BON domain-containing protein [Gemmatimonadales bacterium]|nr:BON domain-containing protein [Gemmatimonadales bacterium]
MNSDPDIQRDVVAQLEAEPNLRWEDTAVGVRDGVVMLAGYVDSYADKWRAEQVVEKVKGVKAVVNELKAKLPSQSRRPDPELARATIDALTWNVLVPTDRIQVVVEDGWISLIGEVSHYYQREEAERTVRNLTGVVGVTDLITVATAPPPDDLKRRITETLRRGVQLDADRITVEVDGHEAILRGPVRSYAEYKEAERAARNAPGITEVENHLTVDPLAYAPA